MGPDRVIALHAIHHMTTFWLYAVDHTFKSSIKYGVAINALIHFIMYAHYAKPFPPAYRQLITQLQIVQFILSIWSVASPAMSYVLFPSTFHVVWK